MGLSSHERITYEGFRSGKSPEEILEELFENTDGIFECKGVAFVWVDARIRGQENQRAGSFKNIRKDKLNEFNYTVSQSALFPYGIHISLDYDLVDWPHNKPINLM